MGNPARYKIVRYLAECRKCIVSEIVDQTPLAQSTVSQHLKVLKEAGLICGEISGPAVNYCIDTNAMIWMIDQLEMLAALPGAGLCTPDELEGDGWLR